MILPIEAKESAFDIDPCRVVSGDEMIIANDFGAVDSIFGIAGFGRLVAESDYYQIGFGFGRDSKLGIFWWNFHIKYIL